jgi:hypothetical protein
LNRKSGRLSSATGKPAFFFRATAAIAMDQGSLERINTMN